MAVQFKDMTPGTKYKFVQYTPGQEYEAVNVADANLPYISCTDNRGATPREDWYFEFDAVEATA